MRVTDKQINNIIKAAQKEPLTITELSRILGKSWVTTEKYANYVAEKTGTINIKVFRENTPSSVKVVYPEIQNNSNGVKKELFNAIINGRYEKDFDFMEAFQFIDDNKKSSKYEHFNKTTLKKDKRVIELLKQAKSHVYIFSGNLSYVAVKYKSRNVIDVFEELLERKVFIKILTRVDVTQKAMGLNVRTVRPDHAQEATLPDSPWLISLAFLTHKS
ncbi:MAG: hypothetical protein MAG795_00062 [Candidatus Woesearchaeota archaeon]|nr:hypothetical protein [Candidatus Woesearchaeota archaeon]